MRFALIPSILFSLFVSGCVGDGPTEPAGPASSARLKIAAAQQSVPRPLAGKCDALMAPPIFVAPGVIRQIDSGTCQLAHLGRVAFYSDKLINVFAGTQTTQASFTAANGDSVYAVGSGTNTPSGPGLVAFTTALTFVGGTGRFEQVEGEASVVGQANLITRRSTLTLEGSIAYTASDGNGK